MGPVLVMSNTIGVNFATFNLLKSTIENAFMSYLVFFRTQIQRRIRIRCQIFSILTLTLHKKEPSSKDVHCCSKKSLPGQFFTVCYSTARVFCGLWNLMQRENRERNFNNTHRSKVGCVMRYSTVPWNSGFTVNKVDLDSESMPGSCSYDGETSVTFRSNIS